MKLTPLTYSAVKSPKGCKNLDIVDLKALQDGIPESIDPSKIGLNMPVISKIANSARVRSLIVLCEDETNSDTCSDEEKELTTTVITENPYDIPLTDEIIRINFAKLKKMVEATDKENDIDTYIRFLNLELDRELMALIKRKLGKLNIGRLEVELLQYLSGPIMILFLEVFGKNGDEELLKGNLTFLEGIRKITLALYSLFLLGYYLTDLYENDQSHFPLWVEILTVHFQIILFKIIHGRPWDHGIGGIDFPRIGLNTTRLMTSQLVGRVVPLNHSS